jgi:endonuclease YncB( thermonuclease family)
VQEPTPTAETPAAADLIPNVEATPVEAPAPRGSRARTIGLAGVVGAIGIGALAIALVAGGPGTDAAPAAAPDGSASRAVPIGRVSGWTSPDGASDLRLDRGGRGGMRGEMGNAITVTAIDGTKLALETDNGWTRTIDATGATVTKDGATVALSTVKVGDTIVFRETRNDDGTYTITAIGVIQPAVAGTVASVSGSTVTVTRRDGSTSKVVLTDSTTYQLAGRAATKDAVVTGARIVARGTLATDGTLTATSLEVAPATSAGVVKEKGASSLTLTTRDGSTVTIKVSSSTTYRVGGVDSPTLADVKVGHVVMAAGSRNADGSLSATVVRSHAAGMFGGPGGGFGGMPGPMPGDGFGRGGMRGGGHGWGLPGDPDSAPPRSTAPTGSGTNG